MVRRQQARPTTVQLPREILGLSPGDPQVDHKNGDTLDNRRANLRLASGGQNQQNRQRLNRNNLSSGVRGVTWSKGKWMARVTLDGESHYLGRFVAIEEAEAVVVAFRREHMPYSEMDRR